MLPASPPTGPTARPLVISEHGIYLRERYLAFGPTSTPHAVRCIMLRFYKHLTWAGYQIAGCIAPGSEYNRQWLEANGAAPERIHPVYNGVDVDSFVTGAIEPDVPTLVWLGRIDPLKDVETLLRAFARVRQAIPRPACGSSAPPPPRTSATSDRCVALRDSLGLIGSATFEGRVDSVVDAYHAGHVVLLTSISEGFPYTLIEAMASGMPTVATDVGGVREATGDAGLVVPPQHPEAMAAGVPAAAVGRRPPGPWATPPASGSCRCSRSSRASPSSRPLPRCDGSRLERAGPRQRGPSQTASCRRVPTRGVSKSGPSRHPNASDLIQWSALARPLGAAL